MSGNRAPPGFKSPYEPTPPGTVDPPGSTITQWDFYRSGQTFSSVRSSWTTAPQPPTANREYIPPPPPMTEAMKNELPPPPPPPGSPPPHASVGRAPASLPFSASMNHPRTHVPMNTSGSSEQTGGASAVPGGASSNTGGASANMGSWPHARQNPDKFDPHTGAPLASENPPLLGNYPPRIDKRNLTPHLLKSIRKSRSELKHIFKHEYGLYVQAKYEQDSSKMIIINARWASAVRRYILRCIRYSRKVGTISPADANKMHSAYRTENLTYMAWDQLEFLLEMYPEELEYTAIRAEEITENYGRRPDDEVAAAREWKQEAHRKTMADKAAKAFVENKRFAAFANGDRLAASVPPWDRVAPWNRDAPWNQNAQSAAANYSVQPVAANHGMPAGTAFYNTQPAATGVNYPVATNYAVQPVAHGVANANPGGQSGGYTNGQYYGAQRGSYANIQYGSGYGTQHSGYGNQYGSTSGNQYGSTPGNQYGNALGTQPNGYGTQPSGYNTQQANYYAQPSLQANNNSNSYYGAQHGSSPSAPPPLHGTKRDYNGQPIKPSPSSSSSSSSSGAQRYYSSTGSFAPAPAPVQPSAQRGYGGTYIKPEPAADDDDDTHYHGNEDGEMDMDIDSDSDSDVDMDEDVAMDISDDEDGDEDGDVYIKSEFAGSG